MVFNVWETSKFLTNSNKQNNRLYGTPKERPMNLLFDTQIGVTLKYQTRDRTNFQNKISALKIEMAWAFFSYINSKVT